MLGFCIRQLAIFGSGAVAAINLPGGGEYVPALWKVWVAIGMAVVFSAIQWHDVKRGLP